MNTKNLFCREIMLDSQELIIPRTTYQRTLNEDRVRKIAAEFGERIAMNSPIQGTAADIIKIAMIHVDQKLRERNLESRLILQIHDELLIETKESEIDEVTKILEHEMVAAAELRVPLIAEVKRGNSWYEAK